MAREGAFEGVDAVVMLHPFSYDVAIQPFLGRRQVRATYRGVAAHSLGAAVHGAQRPRRRRRGVHRIAMLRQHITPATACTDRRRRRAAAQRGARDGECGVLRPVPPNRPRCRPVRAGGPRPACAAAMTGTGVELEWDRQPAYLPIRRTGSSRPAGRRTSSAGAGRHCPRASCPRRCRGRPTSGTSASVYRRSTRCSRSPPPTCHCTRRSSRRPPGRRRATAGCSTGPSGWRSRPSTCSPTPTCSPRCARSSRRRAGLLDVEEFLR